MEITTPLHTLVNAIDAGYLARHDPERPYLGASIIGHPCRRFLWLSFRHALPPVTDPRLLRIFRHGHMIEAEVVRAIRQAGIKVRYTGHKQRYINLGAHCGGHADGVITSGLPESPKTPHLLEVKSAKNSQFNALKKGGIEKERPQHYVQMQLYMKGLELTRGMYVVVNKDTDELYTERVRYDEQVALIALNRASAIIYAERAPERMSNDASWFRCKMCPGYGMCHQAQPTAAVNCRTCAHSTPERDGGWSCAPDMPDEVANCPAHTLHPDVIGLEPLQDPASPWLFRYAIRGQEISNGAGGMPSAEVLRLINGA